MIATRLVFLILALVLFLPFFTKISYSNQMRIIEKIILAFIFGIGIVLIIDPSLLNILAKYLKTDRRQDILIYTYIILSFWGLLRSHIRLNKLSSKINNLISESALISSRINNEINKKKNKKKK